MSNKLHSVYRLILALVIILLNSLVLCLLLIGINNLFSYLYDVVLFTEFTHFNLDGYIHTITVVTFIDAMYYNYNKTKL